MSEQASDGVRRPRGRPRLLSEEQVIEAALDLAAESGRMEDVSMRALAQRLGVPVMTIYNYVPNREALSAMVSNHVLAAVRVPDPEEGSWEERILQLERSVRQAMARHPGVSLDRSGAGGSEAARLAEGVMEILRAAGFDPLSASLAFTTMSMFMLGQMEVDSVGAGHGISQMVSAVSTGERWSSDRIFEFGFNAVIEGLKANLATADWRQEGIRASAKRPARSRRS